MISLALGFISWCYFLMFIYQYIKIKYILIDLCKLDKSKKYIHEYRVKTGEYFQSLDLGDVSNTNKIIIPNILHHNIKATLGTAINNIDKSIYIIKYITYPEIVKLKTIYKYNFDPTEYRFTKYHCFINYIKLDTIYLYEELINGKHIVERYSNTKELLISEIVAEDTKLMYILLTCSLIYIGLLIAYCIY